MAATHTVGDRIAASPAGSHLLRAWHRYFNRLGNQLAGSIAFFSMLALVPVLMFAFSAVGFTLTVIRPALMSQVQMFIVENLSAGPLQDQVLILLSEYLYNWRSVGLVALLVALFVGSSWVANLKGAIRGMGRPDFDLTHRRHSALLEPVINVMLLLVFMALIAITFTATVVGTQLAGAIVSWLELGNVIVTQTLVRMSSFSLSLVGATALFWLIFRFLPEERSPHVAIVRGSVGAAVCFVALQAGASWLTGLLSAGRATQLFGPVIVAMIFINIFAQLILFFTAWIATWNQPAIPRRYNRADAILRERSTTVAVERHWEAAEADQVRQARPVRVLARTKHLIETTGPAVRIRTGASPVGRRRSGVPLSAGRAAGQACRSGD